MFSSIEKSEEKHSKIRTKSRKSVKNRNNSILSSFAKDHSYQQSLCQSRISLSKNSTEISDSEKYQQKIKELSQENTNLLDLIHSNEKELDFCNKIINQFLDVNELFKIKQKSVYDESSKSWNIPNFIVQQRKTIFPKLQRSQLKEVLQSEMKQRKIVLKKQDFNCEDNGKNEQLADKDIETFYEGEGRPITSISKYRHSSMNHKVSENYEDNRRSPLLRNPKLQL